MKTLALIAALVVGNQSATEPERVVKPARALAVMTMPPECAEVLGAPDIWACESEYGYSLCSKKTLKCKAAYETIILKD